MAEVEGWFLPLEKVKTFTDYFKIKSHEHRPAPIQSEEGAFRMISH